jgi:UDP-N-acetyl-D-glucosamine/UDP-N-acetyl-D-galactosamine dehydrogenase
LRKLVVEGGTLADLKGMWRERDLGGSIDRWAL